MRNTVGRNAGCDGRVLLAVVVFGIVLLMALLLFAVYLYWRV
jgi:hypothetical protein